VDHEAELGVIIGRRCRHVSEADALDYVFGYTCVNDVTARDFQKADGVFARAKGFDTFCPVGPAIVVGVDPRDLAVRCTVDGVVRQDGRTTDMVFGVAALIAYVSQIMTLEPGDLIATGTPAGVGAIVAGQRVVVEVEGIGALANPVVDREDRSSG
jgi:2-keto-4-pentenoate hydratase/2-oxohepta-3-ene-1,7-dioic acid hydratase in catechol pathway